MLQGNGEKHDKLAEQARQYAAARQLTEETQCLKERWLRYNFPVQEILRHLLVMHGLEAAQLATDALDRQYQRPQERNT